MKKFLNTAIYKYDPNKIVGKHRYIRVKMGSRKPKGMMFNFINIILKYTFILYIIKYFTDLLTFLLKVFKKSILW